ncbi:cytosolic-abundant heat soluble protein 77611-like [Palaemon carinicauda]|uniref:cytosolic-abundant heat soluble protein 77611-like n=1 Tax=Palaemon carinicauda TaxID=392227 RepID=UPI0035B5FE45
MKAERDVEAEIRRIAVEENLIKMKMMAGESELEREMEARREEKEIEEARHAKEMEARREKEARDIAKHAREMEVTREEKERRQVEKDMEEARHARELELLNARTKLETQIEATPAMHDPMFNVSNAPRLIPRLTEVAPDEFFDHF